MLSQFLTTKALIHISIKYSLAKSTILLGVVMHTAMSYSATSTAMTAIYLLVFYGHHKSYKSSC